MVPPPPRGQARCHFPLSLSLSLSSLPLTPPLSLSHTHTQKLRVVGNRSGAGPRGGRRRPRGRAWFKPFGRASLEPFHWVRLGLLFCMKTACIQTTDLRSRLLARHSGSKPKMAPSVRRRVVSGAGPRGGRRRLRGLGRARLRRREASAALSPAAPADHHRLIRNNAPLGRYGLYTGPYAGPRKGCCFL